MNPTNFNLRNSSSVDPQLFINCVFDMDYLEVTKNESLRKYEENVYLLGTIFSKKVKSDELSDESSDSDSDFSSVDEEIINLFENNKSKDPLETKEKFNQIKSKLEAEIYSNKDETITTEPQNLFDHFTLTMNDYQESENQLREYNHNFKQETCLFSDLVTKLRTSKNLENEIDEVLTNAEKIGILSSTFKQIAANNKVLKNYPLNTNLPWEPEKNIVIFSLNEN